MRDLVDESGDTESDCGSLWAKSERLCDYGQNWKLCKDCDCLAWCAHTPGHGHGEEYDRFLEKLKGL